MTERQQLALDFIKKDIELTFNEYKNGIIKSDILKIDFTKYVCSIFIDDSFIDDICKKICDKGYYCQYHRFHSFIDRSELIIKETPFEKKYYGIENGKIIEKINTGFRKKGFNTIDEAKNYLCDYKSSCIAPVKKSLFKRIFNL